MEAISDPILSIMQQRQAAEAASAAAEATQDLGREEFLSLLIAQLQNQDPLNPAEDTEFISQLATFSSLEQLIAANDNLINLAIGQASLVNAQALSLIGMEALVEVGDEIEITDGVPHQLVYVVPQEAESATLRIYDDEDNLVRTIELETTPNGRVTLPWDGTDDEGNPLEDGTYRIEVTATDLEGEPLAIALFRALTIDGVNFGPEGVSLVSGDREVLFEDILEIRAAQSDV
jgi:flagellar basal-body rod modification protein FlgD